MKAKFPVAARAAFSERRRGVVATVCDESAVNRSSRPARTILSIAVGTALAAGSLAAQAVEVKVSGQINRAIMRADDGANSEIHHVDNDISGTRFSFKGSEEIKPGLKAGVVFEAEFQSNPSNSVTQTDKNNSPSLGERHFSVFFDGAFGTIIMGQGDGAADGGTEVDLSGTAVAQNSLGVSAIGGGIEFTSGGVGGGVNIDDVINNQDFESRYDRLRYNTPALGPVKLALSTGSSGDQDVSEVALRFGGNVGGGKLAAALGISKQDRAPGPGVVDDETVGGSISWLAANGLSVTLATSSRDISSMQEGKFNYVKVGYKTGQHAFAVDYAKGEDQDQVGDEADMVGLAYVYKPIKWAEVYAAYKTHGLDRPGSNFDDITIMMVGSRLKF